MQVLLRYQFLVKEIPYYKINDDLENVLKNLPIDLIQCEQERISKRVRKIIDKSQIFDFKLKRLNEK